MYTAGYLCNRFKELTLRKRDWWSEVSWSYSGVIRRLNCRGYFSYLDLKFRTCRTYIMIAFEIIDDLYDWQINLKSAYIDVWEIYWSTVIVIGFKTTHQMPTELTASNVS